MLKIDLVHFECSEYYDNSHYFTQRMLGNLPKNSTKSKQSLFSMVSMAPFVIVSKNEALSTHLGVVGPEQCLSLQGCHKQDEQ